jgi:hypothetical protein
MLLFLAGCSTKNFPVPGIFSVKNSENAVADDIPDELAIYKDNLVEVYQPVLDQMRTATRYQIEIEIAESIVDISGHLQVLYTNNETENLDVVYFRLFPNVSGPYMSVSNLKIDGDAALVVLDHQNTAVRIELPDPLQPGEQTTIAMDFNQTVPEEMGGNYGLYIYLDDILALDQFFPIIPVYDEEGWNVEDPPINADMIFTDEAFFEVEVSAPQGLILAGSGIELDASDQSDRQVVRFIGGPQRDFFLAASERFESASKKVGDTTLTSYFPEEYHDSGMIVLETAEHALNSYNERFGLYPYTELDLISTPMNAGGMEYSGATSLSLLYFDPDYQVNSLLFLETIVAHEVGHQWFFNQVMSDQIDEPWLDEALVQYVTYLYYVDRYGASNAVGIVNNWYQRWGNVDAAQIPIGKPAGAYTVREYSPIVYGRGPLFFAALRDQIGEEAFNDLLRIYLDDYRWGIADGEDFKALAEETCDCDLTALFNEWVYEE